ncbi:transposase [Aneurinibacillus sp. BA2021]|nr:transposase [Aneurinibacillus sp. BA2021]
MKEWRPNTGIRVEMAYDSLCFFCTSFSSHFPAVAFPESWRLSFSPSFSSALRHYPTRWAKDGFTVHPDGRIVLKRGIWNGKRQAPLVVRVATLPVGMIKEIELVYDRGLQLTLSYEDGKQEAEPTGSHVCAIDPGEIHSIAAVAQEIKKVTFGDVEGIQRNTSARRKKKSSKARFRSRKQNQRMSQWKFGKLYAYLAYKLEAMGIALSKQDERYTSQTCPVCGRRKKTSGRTYTCGYEQHRDVHGAANQLALVLYGSIQPHPFAIQMPTYLRIA